MRKFMNVLAGVALCSATLGACANVSPRHTIHMQVVDAETGEMVHHPVCTVYDGNGAIHGITRNPAEVSVPRGRMMVDIQCKKHGYRQVNSAMGRGFENVTYMSDVIWSGWSEYSVSNTEGSSADESAAPEYKYNENYNATYPTHYVVTMEKMDKMEKKHKMRKHDKMEKMEKEEKMEKMEKMGKMK